MYLKIPLSSEHETILFFSIYRTLTSLSWETLRTKSRNSRSSWLSSDSEVKSFEAWPIFRPLADNPGPVSWLLTRPENRIPKSKESLRPPESPSSRKIGFSTRSELSKRKPFCPTFRVRSVSKIWPMPDIRFKCFGLKKLNLFEKNVGR